MAQLPDSARRKLCRSCDVKRVLLFALTGLILFCGLGALAAVALSRGSAISIASLPVYPHTSHGAIASKLNPNLTVPSLDSFYFESPDNPQLVQDYYANWFAAHGWRSK